MPKVFWLTGLPAAGKTTIAQELKRHLHNIMLMDGDVVRKGLNRDLGFSDEDREENIRRVAHVTKLGYDSGCSVIAAFISPFRRDRSFARSLIPEGDFLEVFVEASLEECERRDPKGMYKKARAGLIKKFTGVDSPYEEPENPEVVVNTEYLTVDGAVGRIMGAAKVVNVQYPHTLFVGSFHIFHKKHWETMKKSYIQDRKRPILVLIKDNAESVTTNFRKRMVEHSLKKTGVVATVVVVPNCFVSVPSEFDLDSVGVNAAEVWKMRWDGDAAWKDQVGPGVVDFLEKEYRS